MNALETMKGHNINIAPKPSTYGQIKKLHSKLFEELQKAGYRHLDIFNMSLSRALMAMYGSINVIDHILGPRTYDSVRQPVSVLSPWRKAWIRVRQASHVKYLARVEAITSLASAIEGCTAVGVSNFEILSGIREALDPVGWSFAS